MNELIKAISDSVNKANRILKDAYCDKHDFDKLQPTISDPIRMIPCPKCRQESGIAKQNEAAKEHRETLRRLVSLLTDSQREALCMEALQVSRERMDCSNPGAYANKFSGFLANVRSIIGTHEADESNWQVDQMPRPIQRRID